ncbi:TPA: CHAT domain-containing protein [Klebsiella michiganensis]|nr:CHAT domain-containing protein [Klebsiella michiganensis]HDV9066888.1 CHAT domain-containing protein [Klebsiella michiganensis]HDV9073196.1 CHAT domain-containing protein [Klebsiella michiganensis]
MAMIDLYRRNVDRKRDEIARLIDQKAKEYAKITSLSNKIQSATKKMNSSKSLTTINNKQKEIYKHQADISKVEKKISEFESKISRKNKELQAVQRKFDNEEMKEYKKHQELQDKFQREQTRALCTVNKTLSEHSEMIKNLSDLPEEITVLFLASNPKDQGQLRLDEEVRSIKEMIRKSHHRDAVKLESCWAVRPGDILQYINEYMPTIVHFSGHGSSNDELVLMDNNFNTKLVSMESIVQAMSVANDNLRLVFFNTCYSKNQANKVVEHIECAIGMSDSITDDAARTFSAQFYSSLTFGLSVENSFNQAKAALMLEGIPEQNTPTLFMKTGYDAANTYIIAQSDQ